MLYPLPEQDINFLSPAWRKLSHVVDAEDSLEDKKDSFAYVQALFSALSGMVEEEKLARVKGETILPPKAQQQYDFLECSTLGQYMEKLAKFALMDPANPEVVKILSGLAATIDRQMGEVFKGADANSIFAEALNRVNHLRAIEEQEKPYPYGFYGMRNAEDLLQSKAPAVPQDTIEQDNENGVQIARTQGGEELQQDAYFTQSALDIKRENAPAYLKAVCANAHQAASPARYMGSTVVSAYVGSDGWLTLANISDSVAMVKLRNKTTGEVTIQRLASEHRLDDMFEYRRVKTEGGVIRRDERGRYHLDGLKMARAIGHNDLAGLGHEPDITQYNTALWTADENIEAELIMMSDGFFDRIRAKEKDYAEFLTEASRRGFAGNTAKLLLEFAYLSYSHPTSLDNMTCLVMPLTPAPQKPVALGILDGQGAFLADAKEPIKYPRYTVPYNGNDDCCYASAAAVDYMKQAFAARAKSVVEGVELRAVNEQGRGK